MSYIPGAYGGDTGDVLGADAGFDTTGYSAYQAMVDAAAAAIAAPPTAPVEQYRDFITGEDLTVEEGRERLNADYVQQATAIAESIAATPGYTGGGEDLVATTVADLWRQTRESQGFTGAETASPLPPPTYTPLYSVPVVAPAVVVLPTDTPPLQAGAGGGSGGGFGPSATENYPPATVETITRPPSNVLRPPTGPAPATLTNGDGSSSSSSSKGKWLAIAAAVAGIGIVAAMRKKPSRRS